MTTAAMPRQRNEERGVEAARARARAKRNAWLLAALAVFFYVGYFVWNFFKGG